ncbi:pilus assembly FimT family protein [Sulfurimonas xiamenensis]|nr:type II secretion system protein [Sulfurimonas xiamenensis]
MHAKVPNLSIMKKAFSMIELVIAIVVIGILAVSIIPRIYSNRLQEAAEQVISHIRYTQHLAMVDDKFDAKNADWYKERWQIFFAKTDASDKKWAYTVFSDHAGESTGNPGISEIAKNPLDMSKYLTAGYSSILHSDPKVTSELNIGKTYGITDIVFSANCKKYSLRIAFDHLGRPLYDGSHLLDDAYRNGANSQLIQNDISGNPCVITLSSEEGSVKIAVEPETGYAHMIY